MCEICKMDDDCVSRGGDFDSALLYYKQAGITFGFGCCFRDTSREEELNALLLSEQSKQKIAKVLKTYALAA
ncbi:hypothetical protein FACS189454_02560 [Planctomycetales bacterium]|nr:hypothetical protein FACS189454_02560 [Planctomycetales bacterium]